MTYTKEMILTLADEYEVERKKTVRVPHYYKYKGEMRERSYPDEIHTARYEELFGSSSPLRTAKVFKSSVSGEMLAYFDLELWRCDFDTDEYISHGEYEEDMGEEL